MEKVIQFRGSEISYTIIGQGKPVLLLHGFAEDSSIWMQLIEGLLNDYQFIMPDLPGSGKSDMLTGTISLTDYADCIHAIIDEEKFESVIMIGHSMGGYVMLAFAEKYAGSLVSAGLFHSSAYPDDIEKISMRNKAIAFIKEKGASVFLKTSIPLLFKDADLSRQSISRLMEKGNNFTGEALIQYYEAMIRRPDRTHILKQLHIPFLFIIGEHDKAVPFQDSLQQAQLPPVSYVYILRYSGHMGMFEETEKCIKIISDFLNGSS